MRHCRLGGRHGNHTVRMCDSLCLHAYAVRRQWASQLLREMVGDGERGIATFGSVCPRGVHPLHRYNLDVIARNYFMSGKWKPRLHGSDPRIVQPLCVDMEEGGIMSQNSSLQRSVRHSLGGKLVW